MKLHIINERRGLYFCNESINNIRDSVGALVATLNNSFTKYFTKTLFVKGGKTVGDVLNPAMLGALNNYYKVNKALPGAIFIYRDGVSEGELTRVVSIKLLTIW